MTVKELIIELENIENKDLQVVFRDEDEIVEIDEIYESIEIFGQYEEWNWVRKERKCVKIIG